MSPLFMLAIGTASTAPGPPMVRNPAAHLAILTAVLGVILWSARQPVLGRVFKIIPILVFCYFVPTTLTAFGVIPSASPLYEFVKQFVLPASLLLLTLSLDARGIVRLGPKAGIMLLAGTAGVIIGGPIALWICRGVVPQDAWRRMAYLAGSWIGGAANAVALQKSFDVSDAVIGPIIVVDVAVANIWMGVLLVLAQRHQRLDTWLRGDTSAIRELEHRMEAFQARVARVPTAADLLLILALAFGGASGAHLLAKRIVLLPPFDRMTDYLGPFAWKVLIVTGVGVVLSFTRARKLEGAGASKVGGAMIFLLVACIGAGADFRELREAHGFLLVGVVWMIVHIGILFLVARLIRAPTFFLAVGSQANIGGAASAPIVASAFNPVLAPVGALLAIAGYVLGTVGSLACVWLCRLLSSVD